MQISDPFLHHKFDSMNMEVERNDLLLQQAKRRCIDMSTSVVFFMLLVACGGGGR